MHLNIQSHLEFEKYRVDFNLQGGFTPKRPCKPCCIVCDFPKCTCTLKATRKWLSYQQSLNPKNPLKVITNPNGADLYAWLIRHGLSISDTKEELLIVSPHYQLSKISIDSITFGDSTIQPVGSVHNLGSQFEAKMAMSVHIAKVCCKALHRLHRIQQIKKFLNPETTPTLTHAFGRQKKPSEELILSWIAGAWQDISEEMIESSFLKCGITNSLDGSEDDLVYEANDDCNNELDDSFARELFQSDSESESFRQFAKLIEINNVIQFHLLVEQFIFLFSQNLV